MKLPDISEWLFTDREKPPPGCKRCRDERNQQISMERGERFSLRLGQLVQTWVCPGCGREVIREDSAPPGKRSRQRIDPETANIRTNRVEPGWWKD